MANPLERWLRAGQMLAMACTGLPCVATAIDASPGQSSELQEVVVTAQKKTERLQDVPVPVTVIAADTLSETNQVRLQDYYTQVPGLTIIPNGSINPTVSIRGLTTGGGNPTVAITIDDVPYGSSTANGGSFVPDIDPGELERVEVLRGPQGTLYGANNLGGIIKYVTVDPSTQSFSGKVEAGTDTVYNGNDLGYNYRAMVNIPLSDTMAVRASAFTRRDAGFIDNPVLHIDGINQQWVSGGHMAFLWRPSDDLSLKLSALFQEERANGDNDVQVGLGWDATAPNPSFAVPLHGLQQDYIPGAGAYDHKLQAYSATLNAKLGRGELTSITAFNVSHFDNSFDFTSAAEGLPQVGTPPFAANYRATPVVDNTTTNKFSQELRYSVALAPWADWLIGTFYTHEYTPYVQSLLAEDPLTGAVASGAAINFTEPQTYEEYSAFTTFTFHVNDRFDIQLGGRQTHYQGSLAEVDTGPLTLAFDNHTSPYVYPVVEIGGHAFTYLFTPEYKISPDWMTYVRLASGYRAGGVNESAAPYGQNLTFNPDKTLNYEIGAKGDVLAHLLSIDASVYYISWQDIQLPYSSTFDYTANGGRAKSQGLELSLDAKPTAGLDINGWVTLSQAVLTQQLPPSSAIWGTPGEPLPYSSRFSGAVSMRQDFPLWNQATGFVGSALAYVGNRQGYMTGSGLAPAPRQGYPAYARLDLNTGVRFDASWQLTLYANNVTDRRGELNGGIGPSITGNAFNYIQPRTVGVTVSRHF
jgi:iron complex outermembrane recepter protein